MVLPLRSSACNALPSSKLPSSAHAVNTLTNVTLSGRMPCAFISLNSRIASFPCPCCAQAASIAVQLTISRSPIWSKCLLQLAMLAVQIDQLVVHHQCWWELPPIHQTEHSFHLFQFESVLLLLLLLWCHHIKCQDQLAAIQCIWFERGLQRGHHSFASCLGASWRPLRLCSSKRLSREGWRWSCPVAVAVGRCRSEGPLRDEAAWRPGTFLAHSSLGAPLPAFVQCVLEGSGRLFLWAVVRPSGCGKGQRSAGDRPVHSFGGTLWSSPSHRY